MIIKALEINNFKSLIGFKLIEPNPFTVFVGPNAAGKSNIFEALEFLSYSNIISSNEQLVSMFGGIPFIVPFYLHSNTQGYSTSFTIGFEQTLSRLNINYSNVDGQFKIKENTYSNFGKVIPSSELENELVKNANRKEQFDKWINHINSRDYKIVIENFSRLFIGNESITKQKVTDDVRLSLDASNLEKVLKRILSSQEKKEEITEWLSLLVPEFEKIEIRTEKLSGSDNLLIYEKGTFIPFNKKLISDGTYNLIAILTALFQSDEPQFLCLEEPENGLNPKVVKELVNLFRQKCEEQGHYIWLNTHSQTLVSQLEPKEIILVNKVDGITITKQIQNMDLHDLPMDEAWLTNALGGGIPW